MSSVLYRKLHLILLFSSFMLMGNADGAWASCSPTAANNVDATCTGTTTTQYGSGTETGVTVTVGSGASVAVGDAYASAIAIGTGTVINSGTISTSNTDGFPMSVYGQTIATVNSGSISSSVTTGNSTDIYGETNTVTNSGTISASSTSGNSSAIIGTTATVTNSGTISATSTSGTAYGVYGDPTATVTNSGTISASGTSGTAYGVYGATTATVINSGTISASATLNYASAIYGTTATVTNSGKISSSGTDYNTLAIDGDTTATVTNLGSISASNTVGNAYSVFGRTTATVTNSGSISASTTAGVTYSIYGDTSTVTNSGTISASTTSGTSLAIVGGTTATVINSGTISATSTSGDATGISGGLGNNTLTNTGTISATTTSGTAYAIQFDSSVDSVTLGAGSKIIGAIDLGGGGDIVNFTGGNSNLTFTSGNLTSAVLTGSTIPYAVSGYRAASVDPTSFTASVNTLQFTTRAVSSLIPDFGSNDNEQKSPPALAYAANPKEPTLSSGIASVIVDTSKGNAALGNGTIAVWTRAFGGKSYDKADGTLVSISDVYYGGAVGLDRTVDATLHYGGYIGGVTATSTLGSSYGNTVTDMAVVGGYARQAWGSTFLKAGLQAGYGSNGSTRYTNNNLLTSGVETSTASYNTWYLSPELSTGHTYSLGTVMNGDLSLTPVAQARYLYGSFGSYTESGGTDAFSVGSRSSQSVEENLSLKASHLSSGIANYMLRLDLTGGILASQAIGSNTIGASLLGQSISFSQQGTSSRTGATAGLGAELTNGKISFSAGGEYVAQTTGNYDYSGRLDVNVRF